MNDLETWLEMACREPAHGPRFYRTLLESEVHAIRPAKGFRTEDGVLRFVMWRGLEGEQIVPFFSSLDRIGRILTPRTEAHVLKGRAFLEATRGACVVLNPNDTHWCRLAPDEVAALLETGAVSRPVAERFGPESALILSAPIAPPAALLHSLVILYAQHPAVARAYLACVAPSALARPENYLIAIELDAGDGESVARETSAVMQDVPPDLPADLLCLSSTSDAATLKEIAQVTLLFYERTLGASMAFPTSVV